MPERQQGRLFRPWGGWEGRCCWGVAEVRLRPYRRLKRGGVFGRCVPRLTRGLLFFCFAKRRVTKEKASPVWRPAPRGSLRYSLPAGAAQLGLRPQTVLALVPPQAPLLGAAQGRDWRSPNSAIAPKRQLPWESGCSRFDFSDLHGLSRRSACTHGDATGNDERHIERKEVPTVNPKVCPDQLAKSLLHGGYLIQVGCGRIR